MLIATLFYAGCATRLETGGPYAREGQEPDMAFFTIDYAFALAHSTLDTALRIERDNRELLWNVSPAIKHTTDTIRAEAPRVEVYYAAARAAYIANPTPDNLTWLKSALERIERLAEAATGVLKEMRRE